MDNQYSYYNPNETEGNTSNGTTFYNNGQGDDGKTPTFDICPCCGVEWGNEDYTTESRTEYRNKWLADGAKWFEPQKKPVNWNLEEQLKDIDHETDG